MVIVGYALSTVAKPFFSVTSNFAEALAVRLTDRAGKGIRTSPRDALISDSVREAVSGRAFGLHRSLDQLGTIIGPILAFFLIPIIGIRNLFLISLVPGSIAVVVPVYFVVDKGGLKKTTSIFKNAGKVLNRKYTTFLIVIGIFAIGAYNFSFVVPLVYAILNVATVVAGLPSGLLADRIGKDKVLIGAFGLFAVSTIASILTTSGVVLAFGIAFIYGLYLGTSDTVQRAVIPFLTAGELKGTAYALYYLLLGACSLVANFLFGALWDQVSSTAAFSYSLVTSLAAVIGLTVLTISWGKTRGPVSIAN